MWREYDRLSVALLVRPVISQTTLEDPRLNPKSRLNPKAHLYLHDSFPDAKLLNAQYENYKSRLHEYGVATIEIQPAAEACYYNAHFARDSSFSIGEKVILGSMGVQSRSSEPALIREALSQREIETIDSFQQGETFEGADALWVRDDVVIVGVGQRTNPPGFQRFRAQLEQLGIACISVPFEGPTQHLLGTLQFLASDLCVVRGDYLAPETFDVIRQFGYRAVSLNESYELQDRQAMNLVQLAPRVIMIPNDCPVTEEAFHRLGVSTIGIDITEIRKGRGGLACMTNPIKRSKEKLPND